MLGVPVGSFKTVSAMRLLSALSIACIPTLVFADVFSLSNLSWTLRNANGSIVIPAKVPSQVHLDLFDAGIIGDPLLEQNGASPARACLWH